MINFRRKRTSEPDYSLNLGTIDGAPITTFPGPIVESLRRMTSRLARDGQLPDRFAVCSALRQEGVTTTARGLATIVANDLNAKVCLVDLNWWWPSEDAISSKPNAGMAGLLDKTANLDEVLLATSLPNLWVLPAGELSEARRPLIARSTELSQMLDELCLQFDYLVLDIPAILATSDAIPLLTLAPTCCLVISQGVTHTEDVARALDEIRHADIVGVVLNRIQLKTPRALLRLVATN